MYADNDRSRFDSLAQQLVRGKPDVIFSSSSPLIHALLRATKTIPIVMATCNNPVGHKLIASFARPGGTVTGIATLTDDLIPKIIQLGREVAPDVKKVGLMISSGNPDLEAYSRGFESATRTLGLSSFRYIVSDPDEIEPAFVRMKRDGIGTIIISSEPLYFNQRNRLGQMGVRHRIVAIGGWRDSVAAGMLMSYGPSLTGSYRQAASHVDRILKGAAPSTLPVEFPAIHELVLNATTAKTLGIQLPQSLLLRADEVIE